MEQKKDIKKSAVKKISSKKTAPVSGTSKKTISKKRAVIKTGGKQYLVKVGDEILIEKLDKKEKAKIVFETVLAVFEGTEMIDLGAPKSKIKVEAEILEQTKSSKIYVIKYKPKTRYRKKQGHRQQLTRIKITKI